MTRPEGVTEAAWSAAVMKARQDPFTARRLLSRGVLRRTGDPNALRLPIPVNSTIRPNKKKRNKR